MSKRFARVNFIIVSILVLIGIVLSVCSFKLPYFPNDYAGFAGAITTNYDMGEGRTATYAVSPVSEEISTLTQQKMQETVDFVRQVLSENNNGYNSVSIQNTNEIKIDIANSDLADTILQAFGSRTEIIIRGEDTDKATALDIPASRIKKVYPSYQQISESEYSLGVVLEFDSLGRDMYYKLTESVGKSGNTLYFYSTDGEQLATVDEITRGVATGVTFMPNKDLKTEQSALAYAIEVYMGTQNVSFEIDENSVTSAGLGNNVITFVCIALGVVVLASFAIMIIRYRDFGLLACLSSLINLIIYLFLLQSLPIVSLSIATIVGCSMGYILTCITNALVFENIKRQFATGKKIPLSVKMGYKNSTIKVVDVSVLVLIASVAIYFAGFEMLKGLAIGLFIGGLLSMFSTLVVTKTFAKWYLLLNSTKPKRLALKKEADLDEE
ncbi:MAG: hypothetical protein IJA69_03140 [Clostridia bacterium]|nr:hypothetical protein [Clostridia bacterium]